MTLACLAQVFSRYVLHNPLNWTEELARFVFVWVSYLAAWLAWKYRGHIAVDAVTYTGNAALMRASMLLVEALLLALFAYTFWTNLGLIQLAANQPSPVLNIPMGYVYAGYNAMALLIVGDILVTWLTGRRAISPEHGEA
ncbi:TRAP transporter small permease [Tianweitania sediminis]|jgi:TRAP-type C4-dicarboxylate transport system permease small subunit|nr:TRAP transporter small permease subunit [Tianweitania sediminis]HEV7417992.1 TRAP transporter small permease subunit [Tianweitania sediminis]